jgi:epoxyqueuosine reductase
MPPEASATTRTTTVTAAAVKAAAAECGFDLCGIAPVGDHAELAYYDEWLAAGYAGEMGYLHRSAERRRDVRAVLPSALSVIVFGTLYNTDRPYAVDEGEGSRAAIARYAWGDDYHTVIAARLERMLAWLRSRAGAGLEAKAYVDTGPVQERVYARHAGVGWIGKNTCVINPEVGSWIFLSEILCNLPLERDAPSFDQCGNCRRCLDSCPTGALVDAYVLDARRCLSYLTIELKGAVPGDQRADLGAHAYGCDICQEVCPYNDGAPIAGDPAWQPRPALDGQTLLALWRRTDDELRAALKGSAMKRAGVRRFRRNLAVAIGNSGDAAAIAALEAPHAPTCDDPLVREHVAWALERLRG